MNPQLLENNTITIISDGIVTEVFDDKGVQLEGVEKIIIHPMTSEDPLVRATITFVRAKLKIKSKENKKRNKSYIMRNVINIVEYLKFRISKCFLFNMGKKMGES
jgi:hypothetical protein